MDDRSENADGQQAIARDFSVRMQDRAAELHISRSNLTSWTQSKKQTFSGYWNGERLPPSDLLFRLADELDVNPRWLLLGEGPKDRTFSPSAALHGEIRQSLHRSGPSLPAKHDVAPDLDLVEVHEIDLAYGLGGTFSDGPVETQVLHFPRAWLESITKTPPSQLTFARGRGDSMMPTLLDGDIVLIDRSQRTVREQDAIWAFTVGDIAMIKRLRVRNDQVHILSDNNRVPADEALPEEVNIVGRVVFIGRRI